ncbi:MAG: PAS domain-containing sensor histidine kinase [Leptolyngbya sp. SIO3F4]|nr:PAS domain-containing sensor histidine kinase [Leptolyngbya sp. SIO3F4]
MKSSDTPSHEEEILRLKDQVATLEELLQVYQQTATDQEKRLQRALQALQVRAQQLDHAKETLQTLETILDSMGDAVVVLDINGQHLFSNPAARNMFNGQDYAAYFSTVFEKGEQSHRVCGISKVDYTSKEQLPLSRAIKGESLDAVELLLIDNEMSTHRWLSVNARPLYSMGNIIGGVAVFRDITKRKQVEHALQQSNEAAQDQTLLLEQALQRLRQTQTRLIHEEKMASLGKTVAGIAHEINNPVNFIQGNLSHAHEAFQNLLELVNKFQTAYPEPPVDLASDIAAVDIDYLAADIPRILKSMEEGTTRIQDIVQSLRIFSRLDEASFKAVDIHAGIDSTLVILKSRLQSQAHRPSIKIIKQYDKLPLVECYASELNQAFNYLISNAIDAVNCGIENPTIGITTKVRSQTVEICITDNGVGIPDKIQPRIFDPFFTTKPVGQGTGLGLSICYQIIVESHNGQITCHSKENQGTQFLITLPIL